MKIIRPKKVAIYAIGSDDNILENELNELNRLASESGWVVSGKFIDRGDPSDGFSTPAYKEMIAAAEKGEFDFLLVFKLNRLCTPVSAGGGSDKRFNRKET